MNDSTNSMVNVDISLIAAVAQNLAIGREGQLLWHLPDDMRYFREITRGKAVLMGRKTWESLPEKFRPLPGRKNIVVTRNPDFLAPGAQLCANVNSALSAAKDDVGDADGSAFIIGGAELYTAMLPLAQRLYLTEVAADFDGDAFFPEFSRQDWREKSRHKGPETSGLKYDYVVYERFLPRPRK